MPLNIRPRPRLRHVLLLTVLLLTGHSLAHAQMATNPGQGADLRNTSTTSVANTAQTKSIAAVASQRVHLYAVMAYCSAGSATLTVKDGVSGTTIWVSPSGFVTTAVTSVTWPVPLSSTTGNGLDAVVGSCGVGNTSTLAVQADQY